jgi:hypothetical protein
LNLALFRARGFTPAVATVLLSNLTMYTLLLSLPIFLTAQSIWDRAHIGLLLARLPLPMIIYLTSVTDSPSTADINPDWQPPPEAATP